MSHRLPPRASTVFWGAVLLLIATVAVMTVVFGSWSWTAVVWLIIAFGALMIAAGIAGAIGRAVSPRR